MSKIDKVRILGLRSFSPKDAEVIQVLTPLTLVVGQNGSGKTTIIEALKYATTGIQPANVKGGAFIHDPKLCGEAVVRAQVKLSFTSTTGAKMVISRSQQLEVKRLTRSVKTLDGSLNIEKNGERTVISSRVAELDMIIPQYLGVSTAVLDNVIFCHQDDSLWPMSEPATLKKKFDEIFEALKYTKAIENIKVIRKKQNEELGKYKIMEEHAKGDKDMAQRSKKRMMQLKDEVDALHDEVTDLSEKIKKAEALADKAWREAESFAQILGALEGKRIEARSKANTINALKPHLKEVSDSDEWIQSTLEQFESRLEELQAQKEARKERYLERRRQMDELRQQLNQKLAVLGKHEQEKDEYERQVERRKEKVRGIASKHAMRGYDDLTDDTLVDEFTVKIRKVAKDQKLSLDRARHEGDEEKRKGQSTVNRLTERKAALQDGKISAKKAMAHNEREAAGFQRQVDAFNIDEGSRAAIESRIEDLNGRMKKAKDALAQSDWEANIQAANVELRSFEDETARLNNELIQGTKKAGETARLAHLKQELKDRHRSLETLAKAHGERLGQLVGTTWQPATLEHIHQIALNDAGREAAAAERDRDTVARELDQLQFKQKAARDDLSNKTKQMQESEKLVREAIDDEPSEYQSVLTQLQIRLNAARDEVGNMAGMRGYFEKLLLTANAANPVCRACERPFKGVEDKDLLRFKKRMENLIKKADIEVADEDINEAETAYQNAVNAGVAHERWSRLSTSEIPALKAQLEELTLQREQLLARLEAHDKIVDQKQIVRKDLEQVARTVASIAKCHVEIQAFERQIEELVAKQTQEGGGGRTLEDIQEDISTVAEKIRAVKKTVSRLTAEKEQSRSDISNMELQLRDLNIELSTAMHQLDKKASLLTRVDEFRALNQKQREAVEQTDRDIDALEPEIATARAKYDDIVQRAEAQERDLSLVSAELLESVNALEQLNDQIKSYVDRGGPGQLSRTKREIQTVQREIEKVEKEQNDITREINQMEEQLRDSENTRRQYADNLRYRQESRDLQRLNEEIQELADRNAEVDRDRFEQESRRRHAEHQKLIAHRAGRTGEMKTKDVQLQQLLADYETDYKDAPKRYKEAHIKVETTKAAVEDLGRYAGALDKAIMKYHSLKMEAINRIIEELWQRTYQGTDIDTVMIKSDNENSRGSRSTNYRVVMIKQDVEMDMRGRCSAGQKVLASIIIRLALAECFSTNCGLIALDEPTTNLDSENIRSLAEALHDIIKHRQQQSNFQLIVITHDEDFLRAMRCEDFTDYYYRVSRSAKQTSIIEQQAIQNVV